MIEIDHREDEKVFRIFTRNKIPYEIKQLPVGDVVDMKKGVCIERKEISDLIHSVRDGRLVSQLQNMEENFPHNYLIIVGYYKNLFFRNIYITNNQYCGILASISVRFNVKIITVENASQYVNLVSKIIEKTNDGKEVTIVKRIKREENIEHTLLKCLGFNIKQVQSYIVKHRFLDIFTLDLDKLSELKGFGKTTILHLKQLVEALKR